MPLEFRGLAIIGPPQRRVRFGFAIRFVTDRYHMRNLSRGANGPCDETDLSEAEMIGVFELHEDVIRAAASLC